MKHMIIDNGIIETVVGPRSFLAVPLRVCRSNEFISLRVEGKGADMLVSATISELREIIARVDAGIL